MGLDRYRELRDFGETPEPKGRVSRKRGRSFVVQKHAARRLHYDFRLEMDGVLRSWAVTRGPSLDPGQRRLAVHVEDHPLDYGSFEGTIPKRAYGAGTVMLWDRGSWEPIGDAAKGYAKGHLEFLLSGEKLTGRWHLVRMQGKKGEKRENWLLIKARDEAAQDEGDILKDAPLSVESGREMAAIARGDKPDDKEDEAAGKAGQGRDDRPGLTIPKSARAESLPDFLPPMLATLSAKAPSGRDWLHEIKFDGYRLQARIGNGKAQLLTRSGQDWTDRFGPALAKALGDLPVAQAVLDGEVVVETGAGASDFSALQADLSEGRSDRFIYYAFDLLHLDGRNLRPLRLEDRKALLEPLLAEAAPNLRYSAHFDESGAMVLRHACRLSLEGVVSKKRGAPYTAKRSKSWLKSKCSARQEFVIGGYKPSSVSRGAIGSLVLGVFEGGKLRHVGRVGTGFSAAMARDLYKRLAPLERADSPFEAALNATQKRDVVFVKPDLVAEVEFRAWTGDGQLRHAAFRGLREDKPATDVVAEAAPETAPKAPSRAPMPRVRLTHPDRVYWPDAGITKEGLAEYHAQVWPRIAPFVVNRPLALLRCPTGIGGQTFFQKHPWKGMGSEIDAPTDKKDGEPAIAIGNLAGLVRLVQGAALEIHPWGASLDDWERPDMLIMDLDPGQGVDWPRIVTAARDLRERLGEAGLEAFVKTSGGKGLHVVAPLKPHATWPEVKSFTKAMAQAMASDQPGDYVATVSKAKRKGRILIDYLRNQRGATAVAAYSPRARPGAPVSTPVSWDELDEIGPALFTVETLPARLDALTQDPWEDFHAAALPLKTGKTVASAGGSRKRR
ncbi:DNA ligase D [Pararhodobacter marinus]|uniref:DNA ligase (ATP) n=1 Tax=Pararhodobacter marinus TaxID=2184063 RepID=A0A2U2CIL7_9RHOB|nr:DNA ligase D [Pararhodobacter marinus]PWE31733.1 DNA ligase D [Pararhodobacter marinus]